MVALLLSHFGSALLAGWLGWQIVKFMPAEKL